MQRRHFSSFVLIYEGGQNVFLANEFNVLQKNFLHCIFRLMRRLFLSPNFLPLSFFLHNKNIAGGSRVGVKSPGELRRVKRRNLFCCVQETIFPLCRIDRRRQRSRDGQNSQREIIIQKKKPLLVFYANTEKKKI